MSIERRLAIVEAALRRARAHARRMRGAVIVPAAVFGGAILTAAGLSAEGQGNAAVALSTDQAGHGRVTTYATDGAATICCSASDER
jgi:hypothetical protein